MKFEKFIKNKFLYLEDVNADPNANPDVPKPNMPSASNVDEIGNEMAKNVEQTEDILADISRDLVEIFEQILKTQDEQKRTMFIEGLKKACSGSGDQVLQAIEEFRDRNFPNIVKKDANMPSL
jgi:hypothetical protein